MRRLAGAPLVALLLAPGVVTAQEMDAAGPPPELDRLGWAVPDYVKAQSGGFLGLITVGTGYSIWRDRINLGATYGYTPPLGKAPPSHMFTAAVTLRPIRAAFGASERFYWYPLYAGAGALLVSSKSTFVQQPDVYPSGYYAPSALGALLLFGTELALRQSGLLLRHGVYVEVVTINQYLDALTQNKEFSLFQAFSSAVGYRASF